MSYGEIITSAWKIIWKYKVLWLFGILAGLGSGGGVNQSGSSNTNFDNPLANSDQMAGLTAWVQQNLWIFVALAVIGLIFMLVVLVVNTYGRIGLMRGAWLADEGAAKLTFGGLFGESGRYFGRVFLLGAIIFVVSLVVFLVIGIPLVFLTISTMGIALLCLIPVICVLAIVSWGLQIVVHLAVIAIVGEDLAPMDALYRAWQLARQFIGEMIVVGLLITIFGGILGTVIGLPFLAALVPMGTMLLTQSAPAMQGGMVVSVLIICLYLPVAVFLNGVLQTYIGTVWTLTFRRLTGRMAGVPEVVDIL